MLNVVIANGLEEMVDETRPIPLRFLENRHENPDSLLVKTEPTGYVLDLFFSY